MDTNTKQHTIHQTSFKSQSTKEYYVIGMMSGTSLDGVDLAYCHFHLHNGRWNYSLISAHTFPYPPEVLTHIHTMTITTTSFLQFKQLQIQYSLFISDTILRFIAENKVEKIDFVALHGHTIFHQPASKITVQALNLNTVAASTKLNTIGNFRELDVMRGGQGAPLAPYGQQLFQGQIFINFGGVCNIGSGGQGWDINYCNLMFNHYAQVVANAEFDRDGQMGRKGRTDSQLMNFLSKNNSNFQQKSLGRQGFESLLSSIQSSFSYLAKVDIMSTYYHFLADNITTSALQIIDKCQYKQQVRVLCTGGGAHNTFLIELLKERALGRFVYVLPERGVVDFKQAIIFGFLGVKFVENIANCSSGVDGMLVKGSL